MSDTPAPAAVSTIPPTLNEVLAHGKPQTQLTVSGWIRSFRSSKNVAFIALTDGSGAANLQVVVPNACPSLAPNQPDLTTGASVRVRGELVESPGQGQRVELHAQHLEVLGKCDATTYPLQKGSHLRVFAQH